MRTKPMNIGAHPETGSPTAIPEYTAPVRSKVKPAYAHSFNLVKPGISMAIMPGNFAQPRNAMI